MPMKPGPIFTRYPIVIAGPAAPRLLVDTESGPVIVSTNGTAYPASVLEAAAPLFAGVPCYHQHEGGAWRDKIGVIQNPRWNRETCELVADLLVTDQDWRRELATLRMLYGFSLAAVTRVTDAGGMAFVSEIVSVESVDLVDWTEAAAGGRFADLPGVPSVILDDRMG